MLSHFTSSITDAWLDGQQKALAIAAFAETNPLLALLALVVFIFFLPSVLSIFKTTFAIIGAVLGLLQFFLEGLHDGVRRSAGNFENSVFNILKYPNYAHRFVIYSAGVRYSDLMKCNFSSQVLRMGLGVSVVIASVMSSFSLYFALTMGPSFSENFPKLVMLFPFLWGALVFFFDRTMVASSARTQAGKIRGWPVSILFLRLSIALLVAVAVATPLELRVYEQAVLKEVGREYLSEAQDVADRINTSRQEALNDFNAALKQRQDDVQSLDSSLAISQQRDIPLCNEVERNRCIAHFEDTCEVLEDCKGYVNESPNCRAGRGQRYNQALRFFEQNNSICTELRTAEQDRFSKENADLEQRLRTARADLSRFTSQRPQSGKTVRAAIYTGDSDPCFSTSDARFADKVSITCTSLGATHRLRDEPPPLTPWAIFWPPVNVAQETQETMRTATLDDIVFALPKRSDLFERFNALERYKNEIQQEHNWFNRFRINFMYLIIFGMFEGFAVFMKLFSLAYRDEYEAEYATS